MYDTDVEHIPLQHTIIVAAPGTTTDTPGNTGATQHDKVDINKHTDIDISKDGIQTPTNGLGDADQFNNNKMQYDNMPKRTGRTRTTSGMSVIKSMESIVRLTPCMKLARAAIAFLDKLFDFQLLRRPEAMVVVVAHAILVAGPFIQVSVRQSTEGKEFFADWDLTFANLLYFLGK